MKFMKPLLYLFLVLLLGSCHIFEQAPCENLVCTQENRMITVKFTDTNGDPLLVKDFKSVNLRTNKELITPNMGASIFTLGVYVVATDINLVDLSAEGDRIKITATNPTNGTLKEAEFVVSGGICKCHVTKISGPEIISF